MYPYMAKPKQHKNIDVPSDILWELLTPSEIRMLRNRWHIINLLEIGLSIRKVAAEAKVGTDTVVRIARMIERPALRKMVDSLEKKKLSFKTKTPWIFGKSD